MPDPYVKQTWIDGVAGATPISAARLSYIEDGIENATVEDGTYGEVNNPLSPSFGGVGDGVADDSAALVAALAAGDELYLPFGSTFLVGDVEVTGKRVYGGGTVKKLAAAESALHLLGNGATVEGLIFAGEVASAQPSTDIKIGDGATNVLIQKNQFRSPLYSAISGAVDSLDAAGAPYTVRASGVQILANRFTSGTGRYSRPLFLHSIDNIIIGFNVIRDCNYDAIRLRENDGYCLIHANQFIDIGDPAWLDEQTRDAVDTYWSGDRLTITDNIIRGTAYHGLDIKGAAPDLTHQTERVIITGNQISGCRISGIVLSGDLGTGGNYRFLVGAIVSDNIIERCNQNNATGTGTSGDPAIRIKGLVKYCSITTNFIVGNFGRGIYVHNNDAGSAQVRNIDILDNIILNNGHSAGTTDAGIYVAGCSWVNIRGNTCEVDSTLDNPYQTHGIWVHSGIDGAGYTPVANSISIDNNICRNNTAVQILCDANNNRATAIRSFSGNVQSAVSRAAWQEQRLLSFGAATPTASEGTFRKGDFLFNVAVASGGAFGRMCTVAGNPGTWLNIYGIGTQQAAIANHADPATATSTEIATKQNAMLAVLRHFGFIAT